MRFVDTHNDSCRDEWITERHHQSSSHHHSPLSYANPGLVQRFRHEMTQMMHWHRYIASVSTEQESSIINITIAMA